MRSYIDFHLHTKWSDGEDSPRELLKNVVDNNLKYFAITDHDTIKGVVDFNNNCLDELKNYDITYINGIEISSIFDKYRLHILGLDFDFNNIDMQNLSIKSENLRKEKTISRIKFIEDNFNMKLSQKSIDYLLSVNICAKPHFARCFVEDGYCDNIPDAMRDICCKLPFVPSLINANESISTILKSNGIPIWAHPLGGINEPRFSKETFLYILDNLVKMGLKGIECYYSLYTKEEIDFLVSTAKKYNLFISAGSDYHGKNVKKVKIGEVSFNDIDINYKDILPLINYIKSRH